MPVNRRLRHRAAEPGTAWATVRQHPRGWRRGADVSVLAEGTGQLQAEERRFTSAFHVSRPAS